MTTNGAKGQPITAISKLAGERWKQLGEEEKKPFEAEYAAKLEAYKVAMKDYVPPEPKVDEKASSLPPHPQPPRAGPGDAARKRAEPMAFVRAIRQVLEQEATSSLTSLAQELARECI